MDEQECIKSDVALACFIRAALRGLVANDADLLPHEILVRDFDAIIKNGLNAKVVSPNGKTAREVCLYYLKIAEANTEADEKKYLPLIKRRIEQGNLSDQILARVKKRAEKTTFREAIVDVYSILINCLSANEPLLGA